MNAKEPLFDYINPKINIEEIKKEAEYCRFFV